MSSCPGKSPKHLPSRLAVWPSNPWVRCPFRVCGFSFQAQVLTTGGPVEVGIPQAAQPPSEVHLGMRNAPDIFPGSGWLCNLQGLTSWATKSVSVVTV